MTTDGTRWRIVDYEEHFTVSQSRRLTYMHWIKLVTSFDNLALRALLKRKDGVRVFGAFIIMAELAANSPERGTLCRGSAALGFDDMASLTNSPAATLEHAAQVLSAKEPTERYSFWMAHDGIDSESAPSALGDSSETDKRRGEERREEDTARIAQIEEIYQAYPRHVAPVAARKAIAKALDALKGKHDDPAAWLLERVTGYARARAGKEKQYTPHPATWFNGGQYDNDDVEMKPPAPLKASPRERGPLPKTTTMVHVIEGVKHDAFDEVAGHDVRNIDARRLRGTTEAALVLDGKTILTEPELATAELNERTLTVKGGG